MIDVFRSAVWQLYQHRATTLMALSSLVIGITLVATTASIVDHALFRPLPFHQPDRLVMLRTENVEENLFDEQVSMIDFADWEHECETMDIAAFFLNRIDLPYEGGYRRLLGLYVSPSFFEVLCIKPYLGVDLRDFETTGHWKQIMLSPEVWREQLKGDPSKIGSIIRINSWASYPNPGSLSFQLTGLLPEGMRCVPSRSVFVDQQGTGIDRSLDFVVPINMSRGQYANRPFRDVDAMGRLRPGVSMSEAQAEMDVICGRLADRFPESNKGWRVQLVPLREYLASDVRQVVLATLLAAFLVFVVAIANVVHMMLVQFQQRQSEMAIRSAVGATPISLVSQVAVEFVLIVLFAIGLGLALAKVGTPLVMQMAPEKLRWLPTQLSLNAVAFAAMLTLLSGLFVWWLALRRAASPNLVSLLAANSRTASSDETTVRTLARMTQIQLVATYSLVVAAGLLFLRIRQLSQVDPGFQTDNRISMTVSLPAAKYGWNHNSIFNHAVIERLRQTPGVVDAAVILGMPMGNNPLSAKISVEGRPLIRSGDLPPAFIRVISDTYFTTMGIPLIRGRHFEPSDSIGEIAMNRTAIVSQSMADRCWPGLDPIGRRFKPFDGYRLWMEVVGVVGDVHSDGIDRGPVIDIYYPEKLYPQSSPNLVVHTSTDSLAMMGRIREAVWQVDADAFITNIRTMDGVIIDSQAERFFGLRLLSVLSVIGFVLAVCGIVATSSHSISRRSDELMIRIAFGANPTDIIGLVAFEQLKLVVPSLLVAVLAAAMIVPSLGLSWSDQVLYQRLAYFGVPCLMGVASLMSSGLVAMRRCGVQAK